MSLDPNFDSTPIEYRGFSIKPQRSGHFAVALYGKQARWSRATLAATKQIVDWQIDGA